MKSTFLAFTAMLLLSTLSIADEGLRLQPNPYNIVSDEKSNEIEKGNFVISGVVKGFSSNIPLKNVLIGCLSSGIWVRTDEEGKFSITLKSTDTTVYFYKEGWSELVMSDYAFKDRHAIQIDVWLNQPQQTEIKRKPVIYLYSDKDMTANMELDPKGTFTFTYPEYKDGWEVKVQSEGGVQVDGKDYPYLFWEAESEGMKYRLSNGRLPGFLIPSKDVVSFLEEKLGSLGLNSQERTDFITYWGPLLTQKKHAFIQFLVDDEYEADIASINIDPSPENMRRVYIICSVTDSENIGMEIIPQEFSSFERNGFTVVEWGGTILDVDKLTP